MKKGIIITIITLVVVGAIGATLFCLYKFTNLFNFLKPTNEVFSQQLDKALNLEGANFSDYSDVLDTYKDVSSKSYKSNFNISANVNVSELDSETQKIINNSKIKIESNANVPEKKTENKIGLYSSNSEVLTVDVVTNENAVGIGCKDLYDKYITVTTDDLMDYIEKNYKNEFSSSELKMLENILSGTNSIDPYELVYISDSDLKHFDDTYRNALVTMISKDCYSSKSKVEVDVDGKTVKTTAYYLTLTGKDAYEFVEKLSNTIKNDEVLNRLLTEKINIVLEVAGEDKVSESEVKELIEDLLDELLDEIEYIKDEEDTAIQFAIYSDATKPVRIEFNTIEDVDDMDDVETLLSIEYAKNKTIYTVYNGGKAYVTLTDEYSKKTDTERVGKIKAKVQGMSVGTLDYEIITKDSESKIDLSLDIPLAEISADVEYSSKGNYKKEPVTFEGLFKVSYESQSVEVKFDGNVEFTDNVSIPTLDEKNSANILKMLNSELEAEYNKIMKKASEILPSRLKLLGINIKAEDIYTEPKVETVTETDDAA